MNAESVKARLKKFAVEILSLDAGNNHLRLCKPYEDNKCYSHTDIVAQYATISVCVS